MINIAIDGPSGAGKSTIAKAIAKQLGYMYIDTGAMYRSLAYKALSHNIDIKNQAYLAVKMLDSTLLEVKYKDGVQHMFVDGGDVTDFIRTPKVSLGASNISAIPEVRAWLLDYQRDLAKSNNCIMDGRDIGTTVLPFANIKIFLTASVNARAKRRYDELLQRGEKVSFDDVLCDMIERDENDSNRKCSPLKMADDAILTDTSDMDFEQSFRAVMEIIEKEVSDTNA